MCRDIVDTLIDAAGLGIAFLVQGTTGRKK
jgi:hypothetical protein